MKYPKLKKSTMDAKRLAEANTNPKGNSGPRTASAVEETSDKEGVWAAYEIMNEVISDEDRFEQTSDNDSDMPELEEVSDSDEEGDEVMPELVELSDSEDEGEDGMDVEEDIGMPELVELSDSDEEGNDGNLVENMVILVIIKEIDRDRVKDLNDTSGEVLLSTETIPATGTAEIYNSGCTNHISPYKSQFQNFQDIAPRHFHAANKQSFSTTGKGDLIIDILNGSETF